MKIKFSLFKLIFLIIFLNSCTTTSPAKHEIYKSELFAVEKEFCAVAQSEGIQKAFLYL